MNRSATLSTTGRSFTTGDSKTLSQKPSIISKPSNESKPATTKMKSTKAGSRKVTLNTRTSTTHRYDESFIRYMNGFESYFRASELRNQSTVSSDEAKFKTELSRNRVRYATEVSTSIDESSGSLSEARSYSLDSPELRKKRSLPRVSLVYDTAPHIDLLDSPKSFSETASSYYATPDQDRSFITTPSDNYSFFATASERSSYLTAELQSLDETHTFIQDAKQFSSQETLYNEEDLLKDDEDEDDDDELLDHVTGLERLTLSSNTTAAFSRLNLDFEMRRDRFGDEMTTTNVLTSPELRESKVEAKVRRSTFVRSTCIDLEEEESPRNYIRSASSSTLMSNDDEMLDDNEDAKGNIGLKIHL